MERPRGWMPEVVALVTTALWVQSYVWPTFIGPCGCVGLYSQYGRVSPAVAGGHGVLAIPIPYWLVFIPIALWVARRTIVRVGRPRRPARACPACGYDLRATPDRCPECGREVESGA